MDGDDVTLFHSRGFAELRGLFTPDLIARAAAAAVESAAEPAKHRAHGSSHGHFDFPFAPGVAEQPLNAVTLDDGARVAIGRLLSAPDGQTRLVHSGIVQGGHASPRLVLNSEGFADATAAAVSAPDTFEHGAFTLLPSAGAANDAVVLWVPLAADVATALAVAFDPQQQNGEAAAAVRQLLAAHAMALRVIVRRESADYIQCDSYTSASGLPPALLEPLSVWQRTLLHIPPPGHAYWTADTVAAAVARYGFDPAPYADCLDPSARADALQQVASSDGLMDPHCTYESAGWTRNDSGLLPGSDRHPVRWEQPQLALPESDGGAVLSPEQVAHFHERGYLAMDGIWPAATIREGRQALEDMYPSWEDWNREKQEHPRITQSHDPHVVSPHTAS